MRHTLAALGVFVLSAGAVLPAPAQSAPIGGTWKLDAGESDNPAEKLEAATSAAPKINEGYGSTRNRVGAGRIAGEQQGERSAGGGAGSLQGADFGRIMRPAASIVIEQTDTLIIIRDDKGLPQLFYVDGRKFEEQTPSGETRQTTAKWKDGKLTVERKLGGTGSIKETFTLDSEKRRLVVEAKLTSPTLGKTVEIRRVYTAGS